MITQNELLDLVTYKDGALYWRNSKQGRKSDLVGSVDNKNKYWRVCIDYKRYQLHHLVWLYHNGAFPINNQLDHIDGNPSNNTIENLRDEPQRVNARNGRLSLSNTSGYNGVCWRKARGRWRADVERQDGTKYSKSFKDAHEAGRWQKEQSILHGFHINHGENR